MKQIICLFLLSFLFGTFAFCQNGSVIGFVRDANKNPAPYASVEITIKGESKIIKATVSDSKGLFVISKMDNGVYIIEVSSTGFAKQTKEFVIDSAHQKVEMPDFTLSPDKKMLNEITIVTKKKFIEVKADKTVLNIENNIMASGSSAFDMIKKGPAVSTDKDDNLKLKGGAAQIFVDGKPFYLSGQQLNDYLKNLPADAVSKIEIISNPGSKYEAEGTAGIINLKLKKSTANGLNGTANIGAGIGRYPKVNGGVNLNYRKDKWNVFGTLNYGYSESFNQLNFESIIGSGQQTTYQERDNYWHPISNSSNFRTGLDYSINKKSTIGFLMRGSISETNAKTDNHTIFSDNNKIVESFINTFKQDNAKNANTIYNLNFKTTIDSSGSEFNIDADYVHYQSKKEDINYNYFLGNHLDTLRDAYTFRNNTPANVDIISLKTDYTKYINNNFKIETGIKTSFVKTDNNLLADSVSNGDWQTDNNRSNHFIYEENINAAYFSMNKEWKNWNVQAGVRAEQTNYTSNSVTANQVNKKSYFNLFPSFFASYRMNEGNTFNFSYTRRINRPSYQSLNPFTTYVDPYTLFKGNPYLKPSYGNSVEVKHSFKDFLFTSLSFAHTNNTRDNIVLQDDITKIIINTTENTGYSNYAALNISAGIPVAKWWLTENNMGVYFSNSVSNFTGYEYNTNTLSAFIGNDNTFTLPKNYKIQASVYYNGPSKDGYTKQRSSLGGSFGIQKQVWEKKGTLKFSVSNIGRNAYRAHILNDNLNILWRNQWEGPRFNLNFSWKFGSATVKASRSRKTASNDESNRVNL